MSDADDGPDEQQDGVSEQDAPPSANDDAASPQGLESKKRRLAREKREALDFWNMVFGSPVGRREMWKLLSEAHAFEPIFACGPSGVPQPEATWFHAGEQRLAQRIYHTWARDHRAEVLLMHDENDPAFVKAKK